jgi:hypothetical protein
MREKLDAQLPARPRQARHHGTYRDLGDRRNAP